MTRLIHDVGVRAIRGPLWQVFPAPGGITGLWLLAESHLAVHTYPGNTIRRHQSVLL